MWQEIDRTKVECRQPIINSHMTRNHGKWNLVSRYLKPLIGIIPPFLISPHHLYLPESIRKIYLCQAPLLLSSARPGQHKTCSEISGNTLPPKFRTEKYVLGVSYGL